MATATLVVNLVLCIIILSFACKNYKKTKSKSVLLIGTAFGLFGVSHLSNLLGIQKTGIIPELLIGIRTAAYLLVLWAIFNFGKATENKTEEEK